MANDEPGKQVELTYDPNDWGSHEMNHLWEAEIGLSMTPAERLHWLEKTVEEFRPFVGAASRLEPTGGSR